MSSSTTTEPSPSTLPASVVADPITDHEASSRGPVLFLLFSAGAWLVVSVLLGFLSSVQMHNSTLFSDCAWLTYGRVYAGATNAFLYGFALQASLAVAIWLICRLGKTKFVAPGIASIGAGFWNLGVTIGIIGIFAGHSTGYEWFELPGYSAMLLFCAYSVLGILALITFHHRQPGELYVSQWFLVAALFWFPWIHTTATALLICAPVRGVMQAVVAWWYANNLSTIFFGFVGLATLFYFIPKLLRRPLYSRSYAKMAFWLLAFFGSLCGIPAGAPVPAWIPSLSAAAAMLMLIPLLAVAINLHHTLGDERISGWRSDELRFFMFGAAAFIVAGCIATIGPILEVVNHVYPMLWDGSPFAEWYGIFNGAVLSVDNVTQYTLFNVGLQKLFLLGFFGMTIFGATHYIVPRLTNTDWPSATLSKAHFYFAVVGILVFAASQMLGGIAQGFDLADPLVQFADILGLVHMIHGIGVMGELAILISILAFWVNFKLLIWRVCCSCDCMPAIFKRGASPESTPAEVAS